MAYSNQGNFALRIVSPEEAETRRREYQRRISACIASTSNTGKHSFLSKPSIKVTFDNKDVPTQEKSPRPVAEVHPFNENEHNKTSNNPLIPITPGFHYITAHAHSHNAWGEFLPLIEESVPVYIHMSYADCITTQQAIQERSLINPLTLYRIAPEYVYSHQSNPMNFSRPHPPPVVEDWSAGW